MTAAANITAVIPTYNRKAVVTRAVDSVLAQTLAPREVLVVDDGSTDGTAELLREKYGDRIRVITQPNAGVSAARRRGIDEASSAWIAYLDSDDVWRPEKLAIQSAAMERVPDDVVWLFSNFEIERDNGHRDGVFESYALKCESPMQVFDDPVGVCFPIMFPFLQCSVLRRSTLLKVNAFSERLRSSEDFLLAIQLANEGRFAATPEPVATVFRTSDLDDSSLHRAGVLSVDYCRARVLAFDELAKRRGGPWIRLHAEAVRGLCVALADGGKGGAFGQSRQQYRHSFSAKSLCFSIAALFGRAGLRMWRTARDAKARPRTTAAGPDPLGLYS